MASANDYSTRGSTCYGTRPTRGAVFIDNPPTSTRVPPCATVRTWATSTQWPLHAEHYLDEQVEPTYRLPQHERRSLERYRHHQ
ncbi:hypothetical protein BRADI_1g63175v3 [Brachypodium distachyon]|uniref:Uncharacterized protein n=1 Tax=Brachypodium distachyon TaxID=15368 RepID=A0A0Q3NWA1_BRADI|nr:hypothetical protein BRADI_1g63175v3 [Brachypodium distachyon]